MRVYIVKTHAIYYISMGAASSIWLSRWKMLDRLGELRIIGSHTKMASFTFGRQICKKKSNKCQKYANRMAACYFFELPSDCTMYIELNWIKLFLDIDTMLLSYFIECWKIQKLSYDQIQSVMWMHILCFVHFEVDLQATFHRFIGAQCTLHSHTLNIYVQATHQPMDIKCWFFESQESAFVWKTMDSQLAGIWEIDQ